MIGGAVVLIVAPPPELTAWLVFVGALGVAIATFAAWWQRGLKPTLRRFLIELLHAELEGLRALVTQELGTNGGKSMKDALAEVRSVTASIRETQVANATRVTELEVLASNTASQLAAHHAWSQRAIAAVDADRSARGLDAIGDGAVRPNA